MHLAGSEGLHRSFASLRMTKVLVFETRSSVCDSSSHQHLDSAPGHGQVPKTDVLPALTNARRRGSKPRTRDLVDPLRPKVDPAPRPLHGQVKPIHLCCLSSLLSSTYRPLFAHGFYRESLRESAAWKAPAPLVVQCAKGLPRRPLRKGLFSSDRTSKSPPLRLRSGQALSLQESAGTRMGHPQHYNIRTPSFVYSSR
jgi:hypothetical protein